MSPDTYGEYVLAYPRKPDGSIAGPKNSRS
jgi:hypothetical protein